MPLPQWMSDEARARFEAIDPELPASTVRHLVWRFAEACGLDAMHEPARLDWSLKVVTLGDDRVYRMEFGVGTTGALLSLDDAHDMASKLAFVVEIARLLDKRLGHWRWPLSGENRGFVVSEVKSDEVAVGRELMANINWQLQLGARGEASPAECRTLVQELQTTFGDLGRRP